MSDSERDAEIGKAHRRLKEVETELNALSAAAIRIGKIYSAIGDLLQRSPENLTFDGQSTSTNFKSFYHLSDNDQKDIDAGKLRSLAANRRDLLAEKERLEGILN